MDSFSLYRDRIGQTLTTRLADAIGREIVTLEEGSEIAKAILAGVNGAKNQVELVEFMESLAQRWTLFGPVLVSEQSAQVGQEVAQNEEKAVAEVENLLKENKLDEALATAGQATQDSQDASAILPPSALEPVLPENPETPPPIPEETIATDTQIAEEQPVEQIVPENPPIQQENVDQNSTGIGGTPNV